LTGKYAGKWAKHCGSSDYTELLSAGYLFDMNKKIDIGADYRILKSRNADSTTQGGSVQAGYRIMKNLHVSLGYNFDKFDANMTGNDYWGKGVFVRLRLKLDDKSTIKK
jgi:outer membrane protein assembly factor BamA